MLFKPQTSDTKIANEKFERIILAAIQVFAQKGFHHAKVADVAKVANVADGTIYLYFKNKDDILISIFEHSMDFFLQQAKLKLATLQTPLEKIRGFIDLHLKAVQKNPELAQVLQVELRSSGKFMMGYKANKFFEYLKCLIGIIEDGQKLGIFLKNHSAEMAARALFGAIDEMALEWVLMKKKKYSLVEATDLLTQMFLFGMQERKNFN